MMLEEIYENYADFQDELRRSKATKLFYTLSYQQADGMEEREILETDEKGVERAQKFVATGKRLTATLILTAATSGDPVKHLVFQEQVLSAVVCSNEERAAMDEELRGKTDDMVKGLSKMFPSVVITRGAVSVKVGA